MVKRKIKHGCTMQHKIKRGLMSLFPDTFNTKYKTEKSAILIPLVTDTITNPCRHMVAIIIRLLLFKYSDIFRLQKLVVPIKCESKHVAPSY